VGRAVCQEVRSRRPGCCCRTAAVVTAAVSRHEDRAREKSVGEVGSCASHHAHSKRTLRGHCHLYEPGVRRPAKQRQRGVASKEWDEGAVAATAAVLLSTC